jgi:hypothetical protein
VSTDVSEEHIASIFRIEKISSAKNQSANRRYIPEDSTLHNDRCENLKAYAVGRPAKISDRTPPELNTQALIKQP